MIKMIVGVLFLFTLLEGSRLAMQPRLKASFEHPSYRDNSYYQVRIAKSNPRFFAEVSHDEDYLLVPHVPGDIPDSVRDYPVDMPSFTSRGGARPDFDIVSVQVGAEWAECPVDVYEAIMRHSTVAGFPHSVALHVAYAENQIFDPSAVTREAAGGVSTGIYQLYSFGLGSGRTVEELKDPELNTRIAVTEMARRYEAMGDIYQALQPWSVRDLVMGR